MKRRKESGVQAYLVASGVLDTGTIEDIEIMKKQYWTLRKKEWKKKKRANEHSFSVSYTDSELRIVANSAKKHKLSRTAYIKQAAISYATLSYIVPSAEVVATVREAILKNYTVLQDLMEKELLQADIARQAIMRIELLESLIISQLVYPQLAGNDH